MSCNAGFSPRPSDGENERAKNGFEVKYIKLENRKTIEDKTLNWIFAIWNVEIIKT